jgi:hypothetical protein
MKTKWVVPLVVGLMMQAANATVTLTFQNINLTPPATARLITSFSGAPYAGGAWAVGNFDAGTNFSGSVDLLFANWNQNGTTAAFALTAGVMGGLGGLNPQNATTSTNGLDAFTGTPVFILVGNAATLVGSTEYIVIQMSNLWPQEIEGVGNATGGFMQNGTILRGVVTTVNGATGAATAQFNGTQSGVGFIGTIPEPSVALLGLLGGAVGFFRRRR